MPSFGPHLNPSHQRPGKVELQVSNTVYVGVSPTASSPLPGISQSPWIPVWLARPLSQHYALSSLSFTNDCATIPVLLLNTCQCFRYTRGVLKWFIMRGINNILSYLVCLHIATGNGRGKGGWVPFLKFTWTHVQTTVRGFQGGEGPHLECVSQSSPKADLVYRYGI